LLEVVVVVVVLALVVVPLAVTKRLQELPYH
jgi:hypothetical protein